MGQENNKRHPAASHGLSHAELRAQLYAYAHALLGGAPPDFAVAGHVAGCASCRAAVEELLAVSRSAMEPPPAPAGPPPALNLGRLRRPWAAGLTPERPWLVDGVGRLWLELSPALLQGWQPATLLGAHRGVLLYSFQRPAEPPDPGLQIDIYGEEDPDTARLSVNVELPDGDPFDQSGVPVALYLDDTTWEAQTDPSGSAQFVRLPRRDLGRMRLAITVGRSA